MITGRGADRKSGSNASGEVAYRLHEMAGATGEKVTRVDVEMSYALTGPLAQFGRSNLVRDLVLPRGRKLRAEPRRQAFGSRGRGDGPARLGAASLVWRLILGRARDGVTRLFARDRELLCGRFLDPHPAAPWRVASFPSARPAADLPLSEGR